MKRVLITGLGPVSSVGCGREAFWQGLAAEGCRLPEPGQDHARLCLGSQAPVRLQNFRIGDYLQSEKPYLDPSSAYALAAASLAIQDGRLDPRTLARAGLVLGSAFGSLETLTRFAEGLFTKGPRLVKPVLFPHAYANTAISLVAMEFGIRGYHLHFASGFISGTAALLAAFDAIRQGAVDVALAGGYDAISETLLAGWVACGWTAPSADPAASDPAKVRADGLCPPAEGAGIVMLESREHALARQAPIYGELIEGALTATKPGEASRPLSMAIRDAMRQALRRAGGSPNEVRLLSAASNGMPAVDSAEAEAVEEIFGRSRPPVVRWKQKLGETMAAAGPLHVIAALGRPASASAPHGPVLINSVDPGGAVGTLVLASGGGAI